MVPSERQIDRGRLFDEISLDPVPVAARRLNGLTQYSRRQRSTLAHQQTVNRRINALEVRSDGDAGRLLRNWPEDRQIAVEHADVAVCFDRPFHSGMRELAGGTLIVGENDKGEVRILGRSLRALLADQNLARSTIVADILSEWRRVLQDDADHEADGHHHPQPYQLAPGERFCHHSLGLSRVGTGLRDSRTHCREIERARHEVVADDEARRPTQTDRRCLPVGPRQQGINLTLVGLEVGLQARPIDTGAIGGGANAGAVQLPAGRMQRVVEYGMLTLPLAGDCRAGRLSNTARCRSVIEMRAGMFYPPKTSCLLTV